MPTLAAPPLAAEPEVRPVPPIAHSGRRHRLKTSPLSFAANPALFAATAFAAGILSARYVPPHPPLLELLLLLAAAILAAIASRRAPRIVLAPLAAVWLITGMICAAIEPSPDPQTALIAATGRAPRVFTGEVFRLGTPRMEQIVAPFSNKVSEEYSQQIDISLDHASVESFPIARGWHRKAPPAAITRPSPQQSPDMAPLTGGVRLTVYAPTSAELPSLTCGTAMQVKLAVHQPDRFLDPGVWDARAYLLAEGIAAAGSARATEVTILPTTTARHLSRSQSFHCRLYQLQQAASSRIAAFAQTQSPRIPRLLSLSPDDAAMLSAMIAGDRSWLNRRIRIGFERTGSFHLLVVSGMHLAIFAGLVFYAANRIRLSRALSTVLTIALSFAYALCTGFGQPVQRSFWMVALYLLARLFWRERNGLNAIGFAALCLLATSPRALFDAGFQMTLLSVITVAGIAAPIAERTFGPWLRAVGNLSDVELDVELPPRIAQFRINLRRLPERLEPLTGARLSRSIVPLSLRFALLAAELLLVSATIELTMSMPMAIYFHRITVMALPVNFLILPLIGLLLPAALLTFLVLLCSKALAIIPAALAALLLHLVVGLIQHFGHLAAADLRIPSPAPWAIAAFILLLAFAVWAARRLGVTAAVLAMLAAAAVAIIPRPVPHPSGALEIVAIDVGQGDSLLVITPDGKTLLIDAGGSPFGPPPGTSNFEIGEDVVSPVLWSRGIRRLDAVALTHAHADHMGGMPAVFANFRPREFWIGHNPHSKLYDALLQQAAELHTAVHLHSAGDSFLLGAATRVQVLAPEPNYQPGPTPTNDDSLVMRLVYGNTSAMMEGDAELPSEERMLQDHQVSDRQVENQQPLEQKFENQHPKAQQLASLQKKAAPPRPDCATSTTLHSDLLKVGHHGSRTSTNPAFLAAVAPTYAVVSVGARNFYGHPRREVLQQLQDRKVQTYRTDTLGFEDFLLDGIHVTRRPPPANP
ncbi:MAG TPA: ComEC/Rec2 family competence protein [Acidisarcina sp.]